MILTLGYPSDNPEQLKQMLREAFELLGRQQEIDQAQRSQIVDLKEQIKLLRDRLFGRKSEQSFDPATPQMVLYRFEKVLGRHGVDMRQPLVRWVIQCYEYFQTLLSLMSPVIHCNETRVHVLKEPEPDREPTSESWMLGHANGPPDRKVLLFDYAIRRAREVPSRLLDGYHGYPMTDDYAPITR